MGFRTRTLSEGGGTAQGQSQLRILGGGAPLCAVLLHLEAFSLKETPQNNHSKRSTSPHPPPTASPSQRAFNTCPCPVTPGHSHHAQLYLPRPVYTHLFPSISVHSCPQHPYPSYPICTCPFLSSFIHALPLPFTVCLALQLRPLVLPTTAHSPSPPGQSQKLPG